MINQRQIDIWRVEAEDYALKIREQFMQVMTEGRQNIPQPGPPQAQPPGPPQGPPQAQPPGPPPVPQ